jgi:predicted ABC-type ATPase
VWPHKSNPPIFNATFMAKKELLVVGGPNGAGKSTFVASCLLERQIPYLSADLIATEFPHLDPMSQQIAAGREFFRRSEDQLASGADFIIESTLSGRTLRNFLTRARNAGFSIAIVFIYLDSADTCVARVRERVRRGGHDVPEADIRRRFTRSCRNFWHTYREIADYWYVVYNSTGEFKRIATGEADATSILDARAFRQFLLLAGETSHD